MTGVTPPRHPSGTLAIVNSCTRSRPVAKALTLELIGQRHGIPHYRDRISVPKKSHNHTQHTDSSAGENIRTHMIASRGSAMDVTVHSSAFLSRDPDTLIAVHLGEAGGLEKPARAVSVAHPDHTSRKWYPDMLGGCELAEAEIESIHAYGFAEAAFRILAPHRILIFALPQKAEADTVAHVAQCALETARSILALALPERGLTGEQRSRLTGELEQTRFTRAERENILTAAQAAAVRLQSEPEPLSTILVQIREARNAHETIERIDRL